MANQCGPDSIADCELLEFDSGSAEYPIFVRCIRPRNRLGNRLPVVMLHGGFHSGAAYVQCPDGRPGWAFRFAERGHCVYVPDWPAHGRSPGTEHLADLGTLDVAQSIAVLLQTTGQAILLAHSAAGPIAWWLAEHCAEYVAAIIGIAPGSPANLLPILPDDPQAIALLQHDPGAGFPVYSTPGEPVVVNESFIRAFWANSPLFPEERLSEYALTVVPESPKLLNERFNIGGKGLKLPPRHQVGKRPILIVTGELDLRHPRQADESLAHYLGADYIWLPDVGITGNGHMLMLEKNSDAIAELLTRWLEAQRDCAPEPKISPSSLTSDPLEGVTP
jgi:pimeloyl-ACP methyl ester carboxylesterase